MLVQIALDGSLRRLLEFLLENLIAAQLAVRREFGICQFDIVVYFLVDLCASPTL